MTKKVLFADIESYSASDRYHMEPREFIRLFQYAWGRDGKVEMTTNYDEMVDLTREADLVLFHNGLSFDLPAIFGKDSDEPLQMALNRKVLDTLIWASVVFPAPYSYTNRRGHTYTDAGSPEKAQAWLGLDNLAFQLGVPGKMGDLTELAKRYNPEGTKKEDLKYELIPLDDPDFLAYAEADITVLQDVGAKLIEKTNQGGHSWDYVYREMVSQAIMTRISDNGMRVDRDVAEARVEELRVEKDEIMEWLVEDYNFPTTGKQPWRSKEGKEVIFKVLSEYGITEETRPNWERTKTGNPSLGGQTLLDITEGTEAERIGRGLATLGGQRSLAELALNSIQGDGLVHASIMPLQRSRRYSVTKPGITVWTARGPGAAERKYFVPKPGNKLVSLDFSNADARVVGAYSGDPLYAKRFFPDEEGNLPDGHELNGRAAFGDELYESDPAGYRQLAKILGHGWNYGGRAKTLAAQTGASLEDAYTFVSNMDKTYQWLVAWQNDTRVEGKQGYVVNEWGGRLVVESGREYTQSPSLLGQNGTRELLLDGLIRMAYRDMRLLHWVVAIIHDEILVDIPEKELDWAIPSMVECLETTFHPKKYGYSMAIPITVGYGEPADDWFTATH